MTGIIRVSNPRAGFSRRFSMNGLDHINNLFKAKVFDLEKFDFVSIYNEIEGRHEAYFSSNLDQTISHTSPAFSVDLKKGELISFEYSYKYSSEEVNSLLHHSNLSSLGKFTDSKNMYDLHVFYKSPISLERSISTNIAATVPSLDEWTQLWAITDLITTVLVDSSRSLSKPIDLRHPYIFYLGHLPAFLDSQLSKVLNQPALGPDNFPIIFERGMDPLIEDPSICHPHSKVPDQWPLLQEVLEYRDRVREKARKIISTPNHSNRVIRVLNMTYEHEAMHAETLLYMVLQDEPTRVPLLPIPVFQPPTDPTLPEASWISMSGGVVKLGVDSFESDDALMRKPFSFGWDNESPSNSKVVSQFQIQHRPVSVSEYYAFVVSSDWDKELIPNSWVKNGESEWKFRTIYGHVSIEVAAQWPAAVSHFQAKKYADSKGCDLPTEVQLVYARSTVPSTLADNHSFSNLHPVPVIPKASLFTDAVGNGWEITSTLFAPLEGFKNSELYPGYSSDFL
jgi:L-histidine Nalpha-methyltransferase / hercynylcysteine S-oxide synthase